MGQWAYWHEQVSRNQCGSYQPKGNFPRLDLRFFRGGKLNVIVAASAGSLWLTLWQQHSELCIIPFTDEARTRKMSYVNLAFEIQMSKTSLTCKCHGLLCVLAVSCGCFSFLVNAFPGFCFKWCLDKRERRRDSPCCVWSPTGLFPHCGAALTPGQLETRALCSCESPADGGSTSSLIFLHWQIWGNGVQRHTARFFGLTALAFLYGLSLS